MRALAGLLALQATIAIAVDPLVDLSYATYKGVALANGVSQWLGLRYASPPLGELRFRAPLDPPTNKTVQPADEVSHDALYMQPRIDWKNSMDQFALAQDRPSRHLTLMRIAYSSMCMHHQMPKARQSYRCTFSYKAVDLSPILMQITMVPGS